MSLDDHGFEQPIVMVPDPVPAGPQRRAAGAAWCQRCSSMVECFSVTLSDGRELIMLDHHRGKGNRWCEGGRTVIQGDLKLR